MFEKQISNLGQFQGIQLETDISVITLNDDINHTYCSKIKWEQDNRMPIGMAQLIMPYSIQIAEYWMKYNGPVVIHANINSRPQTMTQAMMENLPTTMSLNMKKFLESQIDDEENKKINSIRDDTEMSKEIKAKTLKEAKTKALQEAKRKLNEKKEQNRQGANKGNVEKDEKTKQLHLKNDEYNYAYIGKVARFKQVGKTFIVYLEDLGWKFMQKVPKAFRDAYISGQTLDNAFQAICEFMGVEFAYSIEDLSEYNFGADGYSVEKDGKVIEDVSTILSEWGKGKEEEEEEEEDKNLTDASKDDISKAKALNYAESELSGLDDYKKKKKKSKSKNKSKNKSNKNNNALNAQATNTKNDDNNQDKTQEDDKNKQQTASDKIEKYQEEFDEKIKHLFIGNTFYDSNISDPILNYDWITVTPQAANNSTNANANTNATAQQNNQNNNQNNNQSDSNSSGNMIDYINDINQRGYI